MPGTLTSTSLSRFTLFYESESIQGPHTADYMHPRAILATMNSNKQLMISFSGTPWSAGYLNLEVLQIDRNGGQPSDNVFQYYDIEFPDEQFAKTKSWDQVQARIHVSPANPPQCAACHGHPARPIFQGYPTWLGSYGSYHYVPQAEEKKKLNEFVSSIATVPDSRYRHLVFTSNYTDPLEGILEGDNNDDFNGTLADLNGLRVAKLMSRTPAFADYKFAIAGAYLDCWDYRSFFPAAVQQAIDKNLDTVFHLQDRYTAVEIKKALKPFFDNQDIDGEIWGIAFQRDPNPGPNPPPPPPPTPTFTDFLNGLKRFYGNGLFFDLAVDTFSKQTLHHTSGNAVKIRYVLEGRGVDISQWFLDLMQPTYRTMEGGNANEVIWPLLKSDPDFSKFSDLINQITNQYQDNLIPLLCDGLKTESLSRLSHFVVPQLPPPRPFSGHGYPKLFANSCTKCHVDYGGLIHHPFHSIRGKNWRPGYENLGISRL